MNRIKALLSLVIAALFIFAACDTYSAQEEVPQEQTDIIQSADGKQLFKGIAFGQGPVAAALPEVYGRSNHRAAIDKALEGDIPTQAAEHTDMSEKEIRNAFNEAKRVDPAEFQRIVNAYMNKVMAHISESNPEYFSEFESRIRSGSHQKVDAALASMGSVLKPAIADVTGMSPGQTQSPQASGEKFITVVIVVAVAVTVGATVNTAVNVNLAVNIDTTTGFSVDSTSDDPLRDDRLTNLLTQRFATV